MYPTHTNKSKLNNAFTLIELIIVIVIIALLATVTFVAYNGSTNQARETSLLHDAHAAMELMTTDRLKLGSYPLTETSVDSGKGLAKSNGTTVSFHSLGTSYCITFTSTYKNVNTYFVSNTNSTPQKGKCPQDTEALVASFAGNGTLSFANGTGSAAGLASPAALVADSASNLYFTDGATSRIRKVTTAALVSTLAGNGSSSYAEGTGTAALFNWPQAVAIDGSGNLVIADSNNHKIRKLSPTNVSSLFAGSTQGTAGVIGTVATSIQFNVPRGIAYDTTTSTILVADSQNNRIIRLNSIGTITAIYGQLTGGFLDGNGTSARFNYPEGLFVDSSGVTYVADTQNHRIRKISPSGDVTTIAGTGTAGWLDGAGTTAQFRSPGAVTRASDGTIYVSDTANHRIRKIATDNTVTTIAGDGTAGYVDGYGLSTRFNSPVGIAVGSDGQLYVSDTANHRIRKITIQ